MKTIDYWDYLVPAHWISAIVNDDETSFDHYDDPQDRKAYHNFMANEPGHELGEHDNIVWTVVGDGESKFCPVHDARGYGVLPCDCVEMQCHVLGPEQ
jgi:hypothetical protein